MGIKAIDTYYKGYKFRSRLEARWAIYFDSLGIKWEYETEGFEFEDGTRYLPDFWLPEFGYWVEVKANCFNTEEDNKANLLVKETNKPLLKLIGIPSKISYSLLEIHYGHDDSNSYWVDGHDGYYLYNDEEIDYFYLESEIVLSNYHNYPRDEGRFYSMPCNEDWECGTFDDIDVHINKARSARFEFGENNG